VGALVVARGEIWWGETPDEQGRPFLVVSRDAANAVMHRVLVAPVTRRIRGIPSELPVGPDEGLPVKSVASFDNLRPFPKNWIICKCLRKNTAIRDAKGGGERLRDGI